MLVLPGAWQWNFRITPTKIARQLGVSSEAVRLRRRNLAKAGTVSFWRLAINPQLIGQIAAIVELDVKDTDEKNRIIPIISQIDGVNAIINFYSASLRVFFYCEDEDSLERKLNLICSICGSKREDAIWWKPIVEKCRMKLRKIDWEILAAVRKDPFRSAASIAYELGATVRTVNRRLSLLTSDHVGWLTPIRQARNSKGLACAFLIQGHIDEPSIDKLISDVSGKTDFSLIPRADLAIKTVDVGNISIAEDLASSFRKLSGVQRVRMNLLREFLAVDDWLDNKIRSQIRTPRSN